MPAALTLRSLRFRANGVANPDSTAFGQNDAGFAQFDVVTGQPKWAVDPQENETVIAALPDEGLLIFNQGTSELIPIRGGVRGAAEYVGLMTVPRLAHDNSVDGFTDGLFTRVATSSFGNRTYFDAQNGGNLAGQGSPELPRIIVYGPLHNYRSTTPFLSSQMRDGIANRVPRRKASVTFRLESEATLLPNLDEVSRSPGFINDVDSRASVVAFIGHSLDIQPIPTSPPFSVGLVFPDKDLVRAEPGGGLPPYFNPERSTATDPQQQALEARAFLVPLDKIQTQAKIIFFATCYVGDEFKRLWDISTELPSDRAMVVPIDPGSATNLYWAAAFAFPAFAEALGSGKSLGQAIEAANNSCPTCGTGFGWVRVGGSDSIRVP